MAGRRTRLYVASDFHASEGVWRKFINAIRLDVYKADIALFAGDLTGKAIVPIVEHDGGYATELFGVKRTAGGEEDLRALERDIADVGYYSFVASAEEVERIAADPTAREQLLSELMVDRVTAWMDLATERLADTEVPLYMIPGNDDDFVIDDVLNRSGIVPVNADETVITMPGDLELMASGWSNTTPWDTPRELSESDLLGRLERLTGSLSDPKRSVCMIHVPPYASGLDTAPILDDNLRPTMSAGDVLRGPVGSTAVRDFIERYQPLLTVHGHIHESGGKVRLGDTTCLNPGSEANQGVLRGYVVDIENGEVDRVIRVEG